LFVAAIVASVHAGLPRIGKTEHDRGKPCGFQGQQKRSAAVHYPLLTRRSWQFDFLVALPPEQDLLLCARYLFVAAMVAWVHPGPATNRQITRHRGQSAFGGVKFSGGRKAKSLLWYCALECEQDLASNRVAQGEPCLRSNHAPT
jgi:hypothetical protein